MNIQKIIDDQLQKEYEKSLSRERSGKWAPSSFGRCFRMQFWNRKNTPPSNPIDKRTLRVFKAGELFHKFVQDIIKEEFKGSLVEVIVEEENTKGFADLVSNEENIVVDFKSQHSRAFWYMQRKKDRKKNFVESEDQRIERIKKEKLPNILQTTYYAKELKKDRISIVFISKDDLCIEQFVFNTKEFLGKLNKELETLEKYWKTQTLPPANPRCFKDNKTGKFKECNYCKYKDLCKSKGG